MTKMINEEMDTVDLLQLKLDAMKKNRENIPNPPDPQHQRLPAQATALPADLLFRFLVEKYFADEGHEMMKRLINKEKDSLKICLYKEYSAKAYADICQSIYSAVIDKYLKEYRGWEGEEKYTLNPFNPKIFKVKAK